MLHKLYCPVWAAGFRDTHMRSPQPDGAACDWQVPGERANAVILPSFHSPPQKEMPQYSLSLCSGELEQMSSLCLSGIYRNEEPEAEDPWAVIWSAINQKFLEQ